MVVVGAIQKQQQCCSCQIDYIYAFSLRECKSQENSNHELQAKRGTVCDLKKICLRN